MAEVIGVGNMVLDLERGRLEHDGVVVNLRPKAFSLLIYLARNPNRVIAKDELIEAVWSRVAVTDDALTQTIKDIRRAIGDDAATILRSYPKRGYLLSLPPPSPVSKPSLLNNEIVSDFLDQRLEGRMSRGKWWRLSILSAAVVFATAGALAVWSWRSSISQRLDNKPSLIVLTFEDVSSEKSSGYLASGIADDLTTDLAGFSGLHVLSRRSATSVQVTSATPSQIGEELSVRYIVQGSVRRDGGTVRLNTQLIDTRDGATVWARRFSGDWATIAPLQDQVKTAIAEYLSLRASGRDTKSKPGATTNADAYEELLKASIDWRDGSPAFVASAVQHLKQATVLDPNFGRAWALEAYIYWNSVGIKERQTALGLNRTQTMEMALSALSAAEKWPSPLYYQALSEILVYQSRQDDAVAAAAKAISLDPSDPAAYEAMSNAKSFAGMPQEAIAFADAADRVDPVSSGWRGFLKAFAAFNAGNFQDALTALDKIGFDKGEVWTNYFGQYIKAASLALLGRGAEAKAAVLKLNTLANAVAGTDTNALLALGAFPYKRPEDGDRLLDGLAKSGVPDAPVTAGITHGDRLTGEEIRALVFGHVIEGVNLRDGSVIRRSTSLDGSSSVENQGKTTAGGMATIDHHALCDWWLDGKSCVAVFRGSPSNALESSTYFWIDSWDQWKFRVVGDTAK